MPYLRLNGSDMLAMYSTGSLVIHHRSHIYDLQSPLTFNQVDHSSIDEEGSLRITLKDGSILAPTRKSTQETAEYHDAHRFKLRALRHKLAKKTLKHAQALKKAANDLLKMQAALETQAKEIAGEYYECFHVVSFEVHGTNERQTDCDGFVTTPDFASVLKTATDTIRLLEPVADAAEPPPLQYEVDESDSE